MVWWGCLSCYCGLAKRVLHWGFHTVPVALLIPRSMQPLRESDGNGRFWEWHASSPRIIESTMMLDFIRLVVTISGLLADLCTKKHNNNTNCRRSAYLCFILKSNRNHQNLITPNLHLILTRGLHRYTKTQGAKTRPRICMSSDPCFIQSVRSGSGPVLLLWVLGICLPVTLCSTLNGSETTIHADLWKLLP